MTTTLPEAIQQPAATLPDGAVAVVLGTRPEIVKLAGVIRRLGPAARILHTGQHYDDTLSGSFFADLRLPVPARELGIGGLDRGRQIAAGLAALAEEFDRDRPRVVVVQGDTNSTAAGALAANAHGVPLVHVEAGLRSYDRAMPEEHNRVLADHFADLCCAPTEGNVAALRAEGVPAERIALTGNTVVEAVHETLAAAGDRAATLRGYRLTAGRFVLATIHRPENTDTAPALGAILDQLASLPVPVLLPLHPRTRARATAFGLTAALRRLRVCDPLPGPAFLGLAAEAALLVSDSGGLQEECSVLKRPMLVVRRSTERPEVLGSFAELVPPAGLATAAGRWLADPDAVHARLRRLPCPYGDERAAERVVTELLDRFGA